MSENNLLRETLAQRMFEKSIWFYRNLPMESELRTSANDIAVPWQSLPEVLKDFYRGFADVAIEYEREQFDEYYSNFDPRL